MQQSAENMARKQRKRTLLQECPHCIYCGGTKRSTTWDHMPNKGMFPKDRPPGLEFPACEDCNQGSKWFEDIAAFLGSAQWSSSGIPNIGDHFLSKLEHLRRNHPEVLEEMLPSRRQLRMASSVLDRDGQPAGSLAVGGPIVSKALHLYGAKLALALHWSERGTILGPNGRVGVICFSNENLINGSKVPQHLFELLPPGKSLKQGKKVSSFPFEFSSRKVDDTDSTAHWAIFSDVFMYNLFVSEDLNANGLPEANIFAPGCLQTPKPQPNSRPVGWSIGPVVV